MREYDKVIINPKNLVPDDSWLNFRKVRAVVENENGCILICFIGGKCIFPGGKCESDEDDLTSVQRELSEESGINIELNDFKKVLEIETMYDDFFNYRTNSIMKRHMTTTYFYAKTKCSIDEDKMELTDGEKKEGFSISFVEKDELKRMLSEDHSKFQNGKFFDEENKIVIEKIINNI